MTREWIAEIAPAGEATAAGIAERFSAAVAGLRENKLFRQIVDIDPEQLLPYLIRRRGRAQESILTGLAHQIAEGQETGHVRDGNPALMARSMVMTAHGFALSAQTMIDEPDDIQSSRSGDKPLSYADFDAELTALVQRYLAP
jgi:hypothetical protein